MVIKEINENGLKDYVTLIDRLNHDEVIAKQCSCAVLLLALNDTPNISGVVPGKLFEYLRANRPILTIGDKSGDSAKIITKTNHGVTVGFTDEAEVESTLKFMFDQHVVGKLENTSKGIEAYSRKALTEKMCGEFDEVIG